MALTSEEIDGMIVALETAMGSGELTVEYNGRRFTYRDQPALERAIQYFKNKQSEVSGYEPAAESRRRTTFATFGRS